jgi:hypothetical protein
MEEENWEVVDQVPGDLQAEILRGLLEAQGIQVWLSQEGAGKAIGLTIPTLGLVQILVPSQQAEQARSLLDAYYSGKLEEVEFDPQAAEKIEKEIEAEENSEGEGEDG